MTNNSINKAHYDIIYKNVVRRSENTQMDLNCFFEALEDIAQRLYSNRKDVYENLSQLILNVYNQLWKKREISSRSLPTAYILTSNL